MKHKRAHHDPIAFDLASSMLALVLLMPLGAILIGGEERSPKPEDQAGADHEFLGPTACSACHSDEYLVWGRSSHVDTSYILGQDEAYDVADALGFDLDGADAAYCQRCHATFPKGADEPIGVSCESCHGPASDWMEVHNETKKENGRPIKLNGAPVYEDRDVRLGNAEALGMVNTNNVYALVSNCLGCHTVPDEDLVNRGDHTAGTAEFELLSFSQGEVRHHFLNGKSNDAATEERQSLLFVVGKLADLEVSLRNLASAKDQKGKYATAMRARIEKIMPALESIASKTDFEPQAFKDLAARIGALELLTGVPPKPGTTTRTVVQVVAKEESSSPLSTDLSSVSEPTQGALGRDQDAARKASKTAGESAQRLFRVAGMLADLQISLGLYAAMEDPHSGAAKAQLARIKELTAALRQLAQESKFELLSFEALAKVVDGLEANSKTDKPVAPVTAKLEPKPAQKEVAQPAAQPAQKPAPTPEAVDTGSLTKEQVAMVASRAAGALAQKVANECKGLQGLALPKGVQGEVYLK